MTAAARLQTVRRLLRDVPLIDGHNDLPWALRKLSQDDFDAIALARDTSRLKPPLATDLPRLKAGGVGAQFWSVFVPATTPPAAAALLEQIDRVHRLIARFSGSLELALTADDVVRIHRRGKIASLIGMEGGHSIDNSLAVLRMAFALGARYLSLTHVKNNDWADASTDSPACRGLAPFGRKVVREMNRLGMMIDLSHASDETTLAAMKCSKAPVIFSHSSARALCRHCRNVPDSLLTRLASGGGVVMVTFVPEYLTEPERLDGETVAREKARLARLHAAAPARMAAALARWRQTHPPPPRATLADVADHIDHIRDVAGINCVGIGSDYEGFRNPPVGLEDVSRYPALLAELLHRGYSRADIKKVAGQNLLRVLRTAEAISEFKHDRRGAVKARS
jgi:membrane dipeptidase